MENKEMLPATIDFSDPKMVAVLRNTVAVGATDAEFAMFAEYCKATGLNPFKREIWFVKTKSYTNKNGETVEGKVQMMTGINGYLAIANKHPQFDGMETQVVRDTSDRIMKAICKVYRKDRSHPSVAEAYFNEYYQKSWSGKPGIWDLKPTIMIAKVAKSIALREAFPQELNGLYTEDEMPAEYAAKTVEVEAAKELPPPKDIAVDVKKAATQGAMESKNSYQYDFGAMKSEICDDKAKAQVKQMLKENGCILVNDIVHCAQAMPGLSNYLLFNPAKEVVDEILADDLPDWLASSEPKKEIVSAEVAKVKLEEIKKTKRVKVANE
jgi:phage recombination protein Bet